MRASLASASSLIALLLLDGGQVAARPIIGTATPVPFFHGPEGNFDAAANPATNTSLADTYAFASLTTGAGSTTDGSTDSAAYFAVGQSVLARLANSASVPTDPSLLVVRKTAGPGGATGNGNSVFVGTSANLLLLNTPTNLLSAASASFGYTIPPPPKRPVPDLPATVPADDPNQATVGQPGDNAPATKTAEDDPKAAARGTVTITNSTDGNVAYTYTPLSQAATRSGVAPARPNGATTGIDLSQTTTSTPNSAASDRRFAGSVPGASVFGSRTPAENRPAVPALSATQSAPLNTEAAKAFYRILQRTLAGKSRGGAVLANLTADGYKSADADPSTFTIFSPPDSAAAPAATSVTVPIAVVGSGSGELPSSMTIFSPESTTSDAAGDSLSYFFNRGIFQ